MQEGAQNIIYVIRNANRFFKCGWEKINYHAVEWEEKIFMNGVQVSLHPAGHMIGSSQIRVEYKGEVWVVSGDYKIEDDGLSGKFEPVPCNTFITESTFGLPIYNWKPQQEIFQNIKDWICKNKEAGKTSVLIAYSLGKAQRLMQCLPETGLADFCSWRYLECTRYSYQEMVLLCPM